MVGIFRSIDALFLKRPVPVRQRIETVEQSFPILLWSDRTPDTECGEAKFLQRLDVKLNRDWLRRIEKAHIDRELLVCGVVMLEIQCLVRNVVYPEGTVIDIVFQLIRIRGAATRILRIFAPPTRQRPDARLALMIDDIIGIVLVEWGAAFIDETGKVEPRAQIDQDRLETAYIPVRLKDRPTDGITRGLRLGDRAVEQRNAVVPLEVRRVRQHEIGVRDHL